VVSDIWQIEVMESRRGGVITPVPSRRTQAIHNGTSAGKRRTCMDGGAV
jgi:hypothetical protein